MHMSQPVGHGHNLLAMGGTVKKLCKETGLSGNYMNHI